MSLMIHFFVNEWLWCEVNILMQEFDWYERLFTKQRLWLTGIYFLRLWFSMWFFADVFSHMQVDILLFQLPLLDSQFAKKNELHCRKNSLPDISTCKYMHCSSRVRPAKVHRILDGSRLTPRTHPSRIQITEQDVQRASFCLWDPPLLNWFVTVSLIAVAHQHPWHRCAWST